MVILDAALIQQVIAHMPQGGTVIAAISGGADSMVLLHLLAQLHRDLNLTVHVATLDHGLRPESAADAAFVQAAAGRYGFVCSVGHADVAALSTSHADGIEAAARRARYAFLAQVARQHSAPFVMTAHHADDQTETILLHLLRGTGRNGLTGMRPASPVPDHPDVTLLRPLLAFRRHQIDAYCQQHALAFRTDASNHDTRFRRNALRHQILPRLREFNPQIDEAIYRLGQLMQTDDAFLQEQVRAITADHVQITPTHATIERPAFQTWHAAVQQRVIYDAARQLGSDVSYTHILHACDVACNAQVGALAQFPDGVHLRVDYDALIIEPQSAAPDLAHYPQLAADTTLTVPSTVRLGQFVLRCSDQPFADAQARLALPPDARLRLRRRRAGDRWQPLGMGGRQLKLKDWLIDHKIPRAVRDGLPLLAVNDRIAALLLPDHWPLADWAAVTDDRPPSLFLALMPASL